MSLRSWRRSRRDPLAEIDALSSANRSQPSARRERRLVQLRLEAVPELDHSPPVGSWPPDVEDLFAGAVTPPEVSRDELTVDALRSGVFRHGALLVRGLIRPARVQQLVEDIDHAFAGYEAGASGAPPSRTAPWF